MHYQVNHPQVINETIDGEAIMINLATGSYYSLDRIGGDVWALLEASLPVEEIVAELGRRDNADADDLRRGVDDLLRRLVDEELVVPCDPGDAVPAHPPGAGAGRASAVPCPPTREVHGHAGPDPAGPRA